MREAEIRLSQNLGSMDMELLAGRNPAEQACMWLTLKVREGVCICGCMILYL
jgi:hypothetical protein